MNVPSPAENEDTEFQLLGMPVSDDSHVLRSREPFELLVSQFVDELRQGKLPSVERYARRFPPHAARIREVFPVLAMLEHARIAKEAQSIRRNMPDRFPFTRIGSCELISELGRGGMGVVFQARDLQLDRLVAVKILPWRVSIVPEWVARFEQEARTTAQLRHRNIVPVFRYGQENGYCFFIMQFVNGIGLDRVIDRLRASDGVVYAEEIQRQQSQRLSGSMNVISPVSDAAQAAAGTPRRRKLTRTSWSSFTKIGVQAAQALRAAHAAGILHNDIKPGNLLLDADGRVWVTDFGLSQPIGEQRASLEHVVAGTLRYIAPERLLGQQSASCDLYSMGATLYELCLQRPAFDQTDRDELMRCIMEDRPVRPRSIMADFPRGLETIILNCMEKHPADRYPSADALLTDLLRHSRDQSVGSTSRRSFSGFFKAVRKRVSRNTDPNTGKRPEG
ncbi:MAG: serine/threonine-protein kinase [Planctomycetaceae bacterium]